MRLIDTHCHIDLDTFDEDREQVIRRAIEADVSDMLVIGFDPVRWNAAEMLACRFENVRVAAGLHPNSASQYSTSILDEISDQVQRPEVVAIGETGIDLYWDAAPLELQRKVFREQIALARDLDVPFIVHQRDAETEVLDVLRSFGAPLNGVLHCFTGNWHYAQDILELGMHVGLGGAITFKSRTDLHEAVKNVPLNRVVLETDSPFMAPVPHRGERNEPAYVRNIAERLAELRGECVDKVESLTTENAMELFRGLGSPLS
jgi:TatD DNase family protein